MGETHTQDGPRITGGSGSHLVGGADEGTADRVQPERPQETSTAAAKAKTKSQGAYSKGAALLKKDLRGLFLRRSERKPHTEEPSQVAFLMGQLVLVLVTPQVGRAQTQNP